MQAYFIISRECVLLVGVGRIDELGRAGLVTNQAINSPIFWALVWNAVIRFLQLCVLRVSVRVPTKNYCFSLISSIF